MPASARHETRALLRAHLSAASGYRHLTRRCAVCHQLQRLAMEPSSSGTAQEDEEAGHPLLESRPRQESASGAARAADAAEAAETAEKVEAAALAARAADAAEA